MDSEGFNSCETGKLFHGFIFLVSLLFKRLLHFKLHRLFTNNLFELGDMRLTIFHQKTSGHFNGVFGAGGR